MKLVTKADETVTIEELTLDHLLQLEALMDKEGTALHPDLSTFQNLVIAAGRLIEAQIDHAHIY